MLVGIATTWNTVHDKVHLRTELVIQLVLLILMIALQSTLFAVDFGYIFLSELVTILYCFLCILVSTQYVSHIASRNQHEIMMRGFVMSRLRLKDDVDFAVMISTQCGFKAFLLHLNEEKATNYLVFVMEVAQYIRQVKPMLEEIDKV